MSGEFEGWWLVLVTFERRDQNHSEFLPDEMHGAVGWMACLADDELSVRDLVEKSLNEDGLRLVELSDHRCVGSTTEIAQIDSHLSANVAALEPGKRVVWGTIHTYLADGGD